MRKKRTSLYPNYARLILSSIHLVFITISRIGIEKSLRCYRDALLHHIGNNSHTFPLVLYTFMNQQHNDLKVHKRIIIFHYVAGLTMARPGQGSKDCKLQTEFYIAHNSLFLGLLVLLSSLSLVRKLKVLNVLAFLRLLLFSLLLGK